MQRTLRRGLFVLVLGSMSVFGLSWIRGGACLPGMLHCGTYGKPACPEVPLPHEVNIASIIVKYAPKKKYMRLDTAESPEAVSTFFDTTLQQHGWELDATMWNGERYQYVNGAGSPAFGLAMAISARTPSGSTVVMTQTLSGPFAPSTCAGQ
jgi:hypothetical protein